VVTVVRVMVDLLAGETAQGPLAHRTPVSRDAARGLGA
jgi:hypothetical protein